MYIKHSKECFIRFPNTLKLVKKKKLWPHLVFQPTSQCLGIGSDTLPGGGEDFSYEGGGDARRKF